MSIIKEIQKRKTFAIISHPDAGKTTLTEKLLLFSGAIQIAGAVKSNKIRKTATSDFLPILCFEAGCLESRIAHMFSRGYRIKQRHYN